MHTRRARLGAGASDIRSWSTDTIACDVHVLRKTLASGDGGDASVGVWLYSTLPALFSSAEYGGVVRKGCHLQDWQAIIGNHPTRFGSCRNRQWMFARSQHAGERHAPHNPHAWRVPNPSAFSL